jgi:hypothetical protein
MPTLLEVQRGFLDAVLGRCADAAPLITGQPADAEARIRVYANNAATNFLDSLRLTYPAVRRLTGDAYFDQAVHAYRSGHPSRSGDLQWAGREFPQFLAERHADDAYRYLGEVARLDWLVQESLLAADHGPFDLQRLAAVAPEQYDELRFVLHPASRLFASIFPAYTIWDANVGTTAEPDVIDLTQGPERVLVTRKGGRSAFFPLDAGEFAFLEALVAGSNFAAALAAASEADPGFDPGATLQTCVLAESIVDFST